MASGPRDFAATFSSQIAAMVIGLATQSCLAWFLGPEDRGSLAVCITFATLLQIVCLLGTEVGVLYHVAAKKLTLSEGVVSMAFFTLLGASFAAVAGLSIMYMPLAFLDKASTTGFHLAILMIPFSTLSSTFGVMLTATRQFGWSALLTIGVSSAMLLLTYIFIRLLNWGVNGAILAMIAAYACSIVAFLIVARRTQGLRFVVPGAAALRMMFQYGIRYYLGKISNNVNFQVGAVVLAFTAAPKEIGYFALAMALMSRIELIPNALGTVLLPRVAVEPEGRPQLVAQSARVVGVVCGAILLVFAIFAPWIVRVLFSSKFEPAVPLLRIMAIGTFVNATAKIFINYLNGTNRPGVASMSVAVGMAVNLLLIGPLMSLLGLPGAAWAMTASYIASGVLLVTAFIKYSGLSWGATLRPSRADRTLAENLFHQLFGRFVSRAA